MKTRAAVMDKGQKEFEIVELDVDEPGPGEVHIKFTASGLCHSDLHLVEGIYGDSPRYPIVAGHEGAGIIESVGPGVTHVEPGDHVVCSFMPSCGYCRYCETGHTNLCNIGANILQGCMPDGTFRYHRGGTDLGGFCMLGTFSERATVHARSAVKVDPWLPLEVAVLAGCGVPTGWGSAVNAGGVRAGDTAVIFGAGGVGMNAVQGAAQAGAQYVVVVDPVEFKRETALSFGATHVFADAAEADVKVKELTWGNGADQAVITVSVMDETVIRQAFDIVGKGSTVVMVSQANAANNTIQLPSALMVRSEKVLRGAQFGSCNPHYDIPRLLRLWNKGSLKLDELVTKQYTLDQVNDGYQDLRDGKIIRGVVVHG
ncbi:NDMA-dependent alcohol dehydrogenase [Actinomycetospora corticicola]|uniref:S-(Hydroxymethyl)glutathione dehydrogenase/alcohol dehydrogenase n=1 Tax=Actinomycetospora corticicola TaxID=663602 RepID=A0A7Y9J9X1_9PSEU|nr:NDMA-dependent alcohol dehydrogenase [Actinomycetospora corticicola]NYD39789.1 S-(hydroxymethyl)glutathione dehydrogenase/alcohol dehydrogenase [Actinomycetospora corticicola]